MSEDQERTKMMTAEVQDGQIDQNKVQSESTDHVPEKEMLLLDGKKADILEEKAPKDRFMIVYILLLLHGVGTLMPWNMFITATKYFTDYKLLPAGCDSIRPPATMTTTPFSYIIDNVTTVSTLLMELDPHNDTCTETSSIYRNYFLSYLGFVAQVPNVLLNGMNVFLQVRGGSTSKRIIWSIIIIIVMFIVTVFLAMVDSSEWPELFFWITMVSVVIINMANGVYQNSVYGTAAVLPMQYTNAVVLGSNISGTLTSVIMILSIAATPNIRTSAIYYFLAAIFILVIAFDTYFALPLLPFFRYHKENAAREQRENAIKLQTAGESQRPPYGYIIRKCWKQFLGVWLVFFVTLTCFPAIQAGVQMVPGDGFIIPEKYFRPVTCFLFFNTFAMLGNIVANWIRRPGPRWVWIPIVLRLLFIPFFIFCNFIPNSGIRGIPVLIPSNWIYSIGSIVMAFTSGYFSSLTMMYAPRELSEPEHQGVAGMMAAFFLILGIFCGIIFSLPVTVLVEKL